MKKLLIAFLIMGTILGNTNLHASKASKKASAMAKIGLGIVGIPTTIWLLAQGTVWNVPKSRLKDDFSLYSKLRQQSLISTAFLIPLSIIAIQSGFKDLKEIRNSGVQI